MTRDTNADKILEIHKRMVDKTVRVLHENSSWIGRVVKVIDTEHFAVSKNRDADPQTVNMFNIRSL